MFSSLFCFPLLWVPNFMFDLYPAFASFLASCCLLVLFTSFTHIIGLLFLSLLWCWPSVSRAYVLNYTSDALSNDPRAQSECESSKTWQKLVSYTDNLLVFPILLLLKHQSYALIMSFLTPFIVSKIIFWSC
jgi:hypothetical protein